ncbi:23380_t:CDS:2 [Gigaspora margarita]|uniref:23380_t:CDS:1 n=1 Tax=Gigaspora margarita TaxID=4874 RepID=A0ABM8VYK8_GIGMA|nr:23380_t:CDS:2 [Gigaspora margarita]
MELTRGAKCLIRMEGNKTIITRPTDLTDPGNLKAAAKKMSKLLLSINHIDIILAYLRVCMFDEVFVKLQVSYIEIYNERVRDLLNPKNKGNLKVREHPTLGPYVEDLSKLIASSFQDIENLMDKERANSTGATGARLKEGANINKSIATLGKVIASLADASSGTSRKGAIVLTWLLKDSFGGNTKTIMFAAISPADYDETLSTLRYADAAKRIKNKAVVNEDPNARLIRDLKEELQLLRKKLGVEASDSVTYDSDISDNQQVITFDKGRIEKLMKEACETWQEKLRRTEEIQLIREKTLEELGILIEKNAVGVHPPKKVPHLVNLNEDPLMSECLVYQIKPGETRVGRLDSDIPSDIRLSGEKIMDNHCHFENEKGVVTLHPSQESTTMVNGQRISKPKKLRSGFRIILGDFHVFRFNNPEEQRSEADIDWNYSRREMALNYLNNGPNASLSSLYLQRLIDLKKIACARRIHPEDDTNNA